MNLKKILIVDDSELLHRMYELVFAAHKAKGAKLIHAYNGQEALARLTENPDVGLIVLDINMPVMSGLEFLGHWRSQRVFSGIPVIIISTEGSEEDTVRGLKAGARAYLTKPFQPGDLHRVIDKIFSTEGAQHAAQAQ